ncbi:hypothetical protein HMPREF1581_01192 [Gardnerella vaginalis JCP8108]|uniref:Uncharacterized protein n=1 Tax=Gardnerella vaginalis JCP8108 TaxID=1261066 RepID=S4HZ42_GARVA|nr:hypothetical protein HMPREF1581_01192 [Gardnerella vaginalis JCP8108]
MLRFKRSCKSLRPCLFLLSRVCSQNRQIRKQTREGVLGFVYFIPCLFPKSTNT